MKTQMEWVEECKYCDRVAEKKGKISNFNFDTDCFIRYLKMQSDAAIKEGFFDSSEYLLQIVEDMKP